MIFVRCAFEKICYAFNVYSGFLYTLEYSGQILEVLYGPVDDEIQGLNQFAIRRRTKGKKKQDPVMPPAQKKSLQEPTTYM